MLETYFRKVSGQSGETLPRSSQKNRPALEPGFARMAVAVNMYQTTALRNLKTLDNENSYQTAQPANGQPQDPNLTSSLMRKKTGK